MQKNTSTKFEILLTQDRDGGLCAQHIDNPDIQYKLLIFQGSCAYPFVSDPRPQAIVRNVDMQKRWGLHRYTVYRVDVCHEIPDELTDMTCCLERAIKLLYMSE